MGHQRPVSMVRRSEALSICVLAALSRHSE
jgi:hypothetical protein